MSYSFKGRVRYSEIGEDGCLTLPGIQNYYQDCCTFQSENIGQGMEALEERQRAWVLSSWQIVVNRYPGLGETIVALTAPYGVIYSYCTNIESFTPKMSVSKFVL